MTTASSAAGDTGEAGGTAEVIDQSTSATVTDTAVDKVTPDATAQSSSAPDAKEPASLLDAVKAVVQKDKGGASSSSEGKGDQEAKPDAVASDKDKPADGKDEDLPFHTHPRWQEMLRDRDGLRAEVDKIKPDAEAFGAITGFMSTNGLSAQEVETGFNVMALLRRDPAQAYEKLRPIMDDLERFMGERLPDDLQSKVDEGLLDPDTAKETARLREQRKHDEGLTAEGRRRQEAATVAQRQTAQAADLSSAATEWETQIRGKDADYPKKANAVFRYAKSLMAERGMPADRAGAIRLIEEAYTEVNKDFRSALPARQSTARQPTSAASSSTSATPKPTTLAEAVAIAAKRGTRAA